MAFLPLFGDAKVRRNIESKVKSIGFEKAARRAFLPHVLTLSHRFAPMAGNALRVLTFYASLGVKTHDRLLTL
jgi:hypothetical protein